MYLDLVASRIGPPGSARIAISGTINGKPWANVFWINTAGGATAPQGDFDTVVSTIGEKYKTEFEVQQSNIITYVQAAGTMFQSANTAIHSVHAMSGSGVVATAPVDDNAAAAVLSWHTNAYWRGGKPRTYIPGLVDASVSGGSTLNGAFITGLQGAAGFFLTDVNGSAHGAITSVSLGLMSFFTGKNPRPAPVFFPFTGVSVHSRMGTQRRRLGRWTP